MESEEKCRCCGRTFTLRPRKPGFVDECESCWHERTAPPQHCLNEALERKKKLRWAVEKALKEEASEDWINQVWNNWEKT